jgi:hypothetical protein
MSEETELRALYQDAKAAGRTDLQEKIIVRLEALKTQQAAPAPQPTQAAPQPAPPPVAQPPQPQGFMAQTGQDLAKRKAKIMDYAQQMGTADKSRAQMMALHAWSEMVKGGFDAVGNATPQLIKDWWAQEMGDHAYLLDTATGKQAMKAVNWAAKNAEKYPEATKIIDTTATLAGASALKQMLGRPHTSTPWQTTGLNPSYRDLVLPVPTKANLLKQVDQTTVTPLRSKVVQLDARQKEMASLLEKTDGINPWNLHQQNFNAANKAIAKEGQNLVNMLKGSKAKVSENQLRQRLVDRFTKEVESNPLLGDTESLKRTINQAIKIFEKESKNPVGLLKTRKKFDKLYSNMKNQRFVSGEQVSPLEESYRLVRNELNSLIKEKAPAVKVSESLKRQSLLIEFKELTREKAIKEAPTMLNRMGERIEQAIPQRPTRIKRR